MQTIIISTRYDLRKDGKKLGIWDKSLAKWTIEPNTSMFFTDEIVEQYSQLVEGQSIEYIPQTKSLT